MGNWGILWGLGKLGVIGGIGEYWRDWGIGWTLVGLADTGGCWKSGECWEILEGTEELQRLLRVCSGLLGVLEVTEGLGRIENYWGILGGLGALGAGH